MRRIAISEVSWREPDKFTAALILMLRGRGEFALDDSVGKHLDDSHPSGWAPRSITRTGAASRFGSFVDSK